MKTCEILFYYTFLIRKNVIITRTEANLQAKGIQNES